MDNKFRVDITIDSSNNIFGKIYELETNEEYTNFRIENTRGEFVSKVREEYKESKKYQREVMTDSLRFKVLKRDGYKCRI